jgi:hypothetical protein
MKRIALLVIVWVLSSTPLSAQDVALMGAGLASCGEFGDAYRQNPQVVGALYSEWARGFMTGLNIASALENKPMRYMGVDKPAQQASKLRDLCDKRPLAKFMEIVHTYYAALPEFPKH